MLFEKSSVPSSFFQVNRGKTDEFRNLKVLKRVKAFSLAGKRLRRPVIFRVQNCFPRMGKAPPVDFIWETLRFPSPSVICKLSCLYFYKVKTLGTLSLTPSKGYALDPIRKTAFSKGGINKITYPFKNEVFENKRVKG